MPYGILNDCRIGKRIVVTSFIHTSIVLDRSWQDETNDRNRDQLTEKYQTASE